MKVIKIRSCKQCPYCMAHVETTPGRWTLSCDKENRAEIIKGPLIPDWCPLEDESVPTDKVEGFEIPRFLTRRQAE
jgi:hypothetical protein